MKKFLSVLLALTLVLGLAACSGGEEVVHPEAVMLDKEAMTLEAGQTETLSAVVDLNATDRTVTWGSSDETVATVDETGAVTGVAEGTATITVTTNDGGKTATCTVTVTPAAAAVILEVQGTAADGTPSDTDLLTFRSDGTYTMYAMFLGAVEATYDSTYEVVDGVLTVPNPGPTVPTTFGDFPSYPTVEVYGDTVRFTVLSDNGSEITLGAFTLSAEDAAALGVTVGEPIVEVAATGVSLTQDSVELYSGAMLDLSEIVVVEPADATNRDYMVAIDPASNEGLVLMEDNGILGLTEGDAVVTVTTADGGFTAACTVHVTYPEKAASVSEENFFAADTAFAGQMDLTAFGGSVSDVVYLFHADGTVEALKNEVLTQRGYYSLVGSEGAYTQVKFQFFFDGESVKDMTMAEGKLVFDAGIEGLPIVLTETEEIAG